MATLNWAHHAKLDEHGALGVDKLLDGGGQVFEGVAVVGLDAVGLGESDVVGVDVVGADEAAVEEELRGGGRHACVCGCVSG
eukprot:6729880-Prymnesium_polylepis.1